MCPRGCYRWIVIDIDVKRIVKKYCLLRYCGTVLRDHPIHVPSLRFNISCPKQERLDALENAKFSLAKNCNTIEQKLQQKENEAAAIEREIIAIQEELERGIVDSTVETSKVKYVFPHSFVCFWVHFGKIY